MRSFIQAAMTGTLLVLAAAVPAQAGDRDWRDRERASPREVERSWRRVQEERRDLARAQWRGDRGDVREESRELRRAEREFRQDRADLYRAGWGGGWDDDRRRGRDWDDDRRRGRGRDWDRGRGNDRWGRDYDDRWDDGPRPMAGVRRIGRGVVMAGTGRAGMPRISMSTTAAIARARWAGTIPSGAAMTTAITAGAAMAPLA
jgi:hypothetical protein